VDLPNKINVSFNFVLFLQVYLVLLPLGKLNPIEKNKNYLRNRFVFSSSSYDATHVESTKKDIDKKE
jgi:hypothetical protein